jgi:aryl carrier-like protein
LLSRRPRASGATGAVASGVESISARMEPGLPFEMDARTFATTPVLTLATSEGQLDLLDTVAGVGGYEEALKSSEEIMAFGLRFRVLSLPAILAAKRATGRTKDLAQLPALEALWALIQQRAGG